MTGSKPWLALLVTIVIWAGYLVAVRAAALTQLTPIDVGILRSVPAAIVLFPLTLRRGIMPGGANKADIFLLGIIGGTGFVLFLGFGAHFAPVADIGVFTPSMLPVFTTILAVAFLKVTVSKEQKIGLTIILLGALFVGGREAIGNASNGAWRGHILFLTASMCWAIFTVRFRASKLDTVSAVMILVTWSGAIFLIAAAIFGTNIHLVPITELAVQAVLGLSAGLIANMTYLFAVKKLGPSIPAATAALVPVLGAIGGLILLDEQISTWKCAGILIVVCGVFMASGQASRFQSIFQNRSNNT